MAQDEPFFACGCRSVRKAQYGKTPRATALISVFVWRRVPYCATTSSACSRDRHRVPLNLAYPALPCLPHLHSTFALHVYLLLFRW